MTDSIRVVVVDDDDVFAAAVSALLETHGCEVVGRASRGGGAADLVARLRPDVVTTDLGLPDMSGVEVVRRVTALGVPVVVLSGSDLPADLRAAAEAGAVGAVDKSGAVSGLAPLLQAVVRDGGA